MAQTLSEEDVFDQLDFGTVVDAIGTPMLVMDGDLIVRWLNPAAEAFIGTAKSLAVAKPLGRMFGPTHVLLADAKRVLDRGIDLTIHDVSLRSASGLRQHAVSLSRTDLRGHAAVILVIHPASSEEDGFQTTAALQASMATRHIHHVLDRGLVAPVTALRGALQILPESSDPDERAELWSILAETSTKLMGLSRSAAALGALPSGRPAGVNLHEVIDAALDSLPEVREGKIRIDRLFDPSLPAALGWPGTLKSILREILSNAVEAAPAGTGVVKVTTRYRHEPPVVTSEEGGTRALPLEIIISDNGPGIPEDMERIVFFPFVSGKDEKAGLGLTIAVQGVNSHGGRLTLMRKSQGQQVTIALPESRGT